MKKVQRFKKVITSILLLIALLTVQVMQVAAETDQNDTPSVVCSDYSSLYQAFIQANDGDVIGIDNIIDIQAEGGTFGSGERAARGADGETYYVPSDMKYSEWKEQYVDSPVVVDQTQKITKKKDSNAYSVDRKLVNSKEYHDKFESLTSHKSTNESVYQEAMKMLEHRDGTELEDIVVFDARTGNIVVKNTLSAREGQTGLTYEQYETYKKTSGKKVLLHNHPNGGRLSFTDLKTLFVNDDIEASIAVGHNGMVHIVSNPDRTIDIEKLYESLYNEYKEIYANSEIARIYALDDLYDLKIFDYESR